MQVWVKKMGPRSEGYWIIVMQKRGAKHSGKFIVRLKKSRHPCSIENNIYEHRHTKVLDLFLILFEICFV